MKFEVETIQLSQTCSHMQTLLDNISSKKKEMYDALTTLNSMWEGDAHAVFVTKFEKDNADMETLIKSIQLILTDVSNARQSYDTCEQSIIDTIARIEI